MTTDQLRHHLGAMERGRVAANATILDPAIARLRAALATRGDR